MRVPVHGVLRQPDALQEPPRALDALAFIRAQAMNAHRLGERAPDAHARVEAGVGILEHDLDAPAEGHHLRRRQAQQVGVLEARLAAACLEEPHDEQRHGGLPRA